MRLRPLVLLALPLVAPLVVGCGDDDGEEATDDPTTTEAAAPDPTAAPSTTGTTGAPVTTAAPTTEPAIVPLTAETPIDLHGVGAVVAGMSVTEAEAATGQDFVIEYYDMAEGYCYFAHVDGIDDLLFLVQNEDGPDGEPDSGIIGRASVSTLGPEEDSSRLTTEGIGLGDTEDQVIAAYGEDRVVISPHTYVEGHYLDVQPVDPADEGMLLRFETDHGVVRDIHGGLAVPVGFVEGCA
jgi:hypothetical protein